MSEQNCIKNTYTNLTDWFGQHFQAYQHNKVLLKMFLNHLIVTSTEPGQHAHLCYLSMLYTLGSQLPTLVLILPTFIMNNFKMKS